MIDFHAVALTAQPYNDVLFVNASAPAEHLYETAVRRLTTVEDLLHLLESNPDAALIAPVARLASALVPLVSEALLLFELAQSQCQQSFRGES